MHRLLINTMALLGIACAFAILFATLEQARGIQNRFALHSNETTKARVNTFTPSTQANSSLAIAGDDSIAVVWDSRRQQQGTYGIYMQRFDRDGLRIGPEQQVNLFETGMQRRPAVATDDSGNTWVAWESFGQDGSMNGIIARRFEAATGIGSDEYLVNEATEGHQADVVIVAHDDGQATFLWTTPIPNSSQRRIVSRTLSIDGQPTGPETSLWVSKNGQQVGQQLPAVSEEKHGRFVVVWQEIDAQNRPAGLMAMVRQRNQILAGPFPISPQDGNVHLEPSVALGADSFSVAWMTTAASDFVVNHRRIGVDGSPIAPMTTLTKDGARIVNGCAVAIDDQGRAVVAWNQTDDSERSVRVVGREIDPFGIPVGSQFAVNRSELGQQRLTVASGKQRLSLTGRHLLCVSEGSSEDDAFGVNLTALNRPKFRPLVLSQPPTSSPVRVESEQTARPHEPPTFNRKDVRLGRYGNDQAPQPRGADFGFVGIVSSGWTPPDPILAVGPNQIVSMTNGAIAFFDKDGTKTFEDEIENTFGFWGDLNPGNFVFDPEVHFDSHSQRFFAMACERTDGKSFFLLAVSDDDNPNGDWFKYRFDVTSISDTDIDSPNMAIDDQAVYLTADFFGPDKFLVFILDKSDLLVGNPPSTRDLLITGQQSFGVPLVHDENTNGIVMVHAAEFVNSTNLELWAVKDPLGTPSFQVTNVSVPEYGHPRDPVSMGTTARPELFEARFWSCVQRNGSLWAVHHQSIDFSSPSTARWYEIALNGWPNGSGTPTLKQTGEISHDDGGSVFFPSIWVDELGNAAITFAKSSFTEFISMNRTLRERGMPLNQFRPQQVVRESTAAYSGSRWGDYSGTYSDPANRRTFWGVHEYTTGGNVWNTWIGQYVVDPSNDEVAADSFDVVTGFLDAGNLSDLIASDDLRIEFKENVFVRNPNLPRSLIELTSTAPINDPDVFGFRLEAMATSDRFWQRLWLFNFATRSFELVDDRPATINDSVVEVFATGDVGRFIDQNTGEIRAQIGWRSIGDVVRTPKRIRVDQAAWIIGY